jgi:hypothetical protein
MLDKLELEMKSIVISVMLDKLELELKCIVVSVSVRRFSLAINVQIGIIIEVYCNFSRCTEFFHSR